MEKNSKSDVIIAAIVAVVVVSVLATLFICWTAGIRTSNDNKTKFKVACAQSGQSWVYDKAHNGECIPQDSVKGP